jgi:hypothetical protein
MECEFCLSIFKDKYTLKNHINRNKKCISLRKVNCEYCNELIKQNELETHSIICKDYSIKQLSDELTTKNNQLTFEITSKNALIKDLNERLDKIQESYENLAKEAVNRPSNTYNHIRNNLSLTYTLDTIKEEDLMDLFRENLTETVFMNGQKALAKLCTDKIINKDSKKLICCTDISRKKYKYMDKNGNVNEDVEARAFMDKVSKPIKEAGKQVYDTMILGINDERDHVREDDYGKKERLIDQSFQVMDRYKDIINIDDPKYNSEFTNELAILNKQ